MESGNRTVCVDRGRMGLWREWQQNCVCRQGEGGVMESVATELCGKVTDRHDFVSV
jgi:hypothetical protein